MSQSSPAFREPSPVERFFNKAFPVPAGAPPEAFAPIAERYPVSELLPSNDAQGARGEEARS